MSRQKPTPRGIPDPRVRSWIRCWRSGDNRAALEFREEFRPCILSYVERRSGAAVRRWNSLDLLVDDILSETLQNLESLRDGSTRNDVLARLKQVAKSRTCDAARRHVREVGVSQCSAGKLDPCQSRSHSVTRNDTTLHMHEMLNWLDAEAREVIVLRAFRGLSFDRVGELLGVTPDAARMRYGKAKSELGRRLGRSHAE